MAMQGDPKQNGHPRHLEIQYGRKRIDFRLQYSARKTLAIDVHPNLSVIVTAPEDAEDAVIEKKMRKRAPWIVQQQRFFETYLPPIPPRRYVSGESHRYLGRQYRLRVHQGNEESVKMARGQINVFLPDSNDRSRVKPLVRAWFRTRADIIFQELFDRWIEKAIKIGIEADSFKVRKMKTRWGSCTPEGKILLNTELIVAPKACIEYVIVHELCHLREHNHGPSFYALLCSIMPDWKARRERLNQSIAT